MLTVSNDAARAVAQAVKQAPDVPDDKGGLRLASVDVQGTRMLAADFVTGPADDDHVITKAGARVFVEPELSLDIRDLELEATTHQGRVAFRLREPSCWE